MGAKNILENNFSGSELFNDIKGLEEEPAQGLELDHECSRVMQQ